MVCSFFFGRNKVILCPKLLFILFFNNQNKVFEFSNKYIQLILLKIEPYLYYRCGLEIFLYLYYRYGFKIP